VFVPVREKSRSFQRRTVPFAARERHPMAARAHAVVARFPTQRLVGGVNAFAPVLRVRLLGCERGRRGGASRGDQDRRLRCFFAIKSRSSAAVFSFTTGAVAGRPCLRPPLPAPSATCS